MIILLVFCGSFFVTQNVYAEELTSDIENNEDMLIAEECQDVPVILEEEAVEENRQQVLEAPTSPSSFLPDGWNVIDGEKYYVENGQMVSGFKTIGADTYFFGLTTHKMLTGFQALPEGRFYLGVDGKVVQGWNQINGEKYYVENNFLVSGFKTIGNDTYFFGLTTNKMLTGWQALPEGRFYLGSDGKVVQGWNTIDGEKYYVENNFMVTRFKEIDGHTYFFGLTTNKMLTGWQALPEGRFYLGEDGKIVQGWNMIDGAKYYVKNNFLVSGFQTIGSDTYFFGLTTNKMLTGWQALPEGRFYLGNDGKIVQGWNTINGEKYYVENNFLVSGFKDIGADTYFFGLTTNKMLTGLQAVTEGKFYLASDGKLVKNGWITDKNDKYYAENNFLISGFKTIDGNLYFFGLTTKKVLKGWNNSNYDFWYQDANGVVLTGDQFIEGRNYHINDKGIVQGFKFENGALSYVDINGSVVKGVQRLCGHYMYFDEFTGVFKRFVNQKIVIDVSSHQGMIDWEQVKNSGMVDGVILRLGFVGTAGGVIDSQFLRNVAELNRLNIPYSVYLFGYSKNVWEALEEANFLINTIKNNPVYVNSNLFSIYYDAEHWHLESNPAINNDDIDKNTYGDIIRTFVNTVESALGIRTRVYASTKYIYDRFHPDVHPYFSWIADWRSEIGYTGAYEGWQYTSDGFVPGISGRVDMSKFYY